MAMINCPACGKPNPDTVEICQYCGTALKRASTVPLPPLHPGDMPTKKKTSDLESTLPGWLRDIRQGSSDANSAPEEKPVETPKSSRPVVPLSPTPAPKKNRESASPLDFLAGLSKANDDEDETPDWLKSIQGGMPSAPAQRQPAKAPEPPAEEPADWLSVLQQSQPPASEPPATSEPDWSFGNQPATFNFDDNAEPVSQISNDTPDWLNALKAQTDEPAQPATFESPTPAQPAEWQTPDTETPDWLTSLSGSSIGSASVQPEPAKPQPAPLDETPDWLSSLAAATGATPVEHQPVQANDTADWLAGLGGKGSVPTEQAVAPGASDVETPDWLASLGDSDAGTSEPFSAAGAPTNADTPDWLSSLGGETAALEHTVPSTPVQQPSAPSASQNDTPDWLASLGDSEAGTSEIFSGAGAPTNTDTPDWLSSLGGETGAAQTPALSVSAQQPEDEMTDWLSSLGSGPVGQIESALVDSSPIAPASDVDLPPWLSGLSGEAQPPIEQVAPAQPAPSAPQPAESDIPPWMANLQGASATETPTSSDIPDWMTGLSADSPQTPAADVSGSVPATESELPSWLANAMDEKPADKLKSTGRPFDTGALRELGPLDETPDWMTTVGRPSPTPVEIPDETPSYTPEIPVSPISSIPASSEAPTVPPGSGEGQNLDAIFSMDMPDWLSGFTPTEAEVAETKSAEQQPVDENLSPAELPSWVQAMRPVEDVMGGKLARAEDEDAPVEAQGPLAGLRSVLPGVSTAPSIHKPKTYSIRLQVADSQQAQAELLENILNSESTPQAASKRSDAFVMRPLRWIIAGILLIAILLGALLPNITGSSIFPAPNKSAEYGRIDGFQTIIEGLPDRANVLVVADYQPGFAGEMEPAAGPVFDQLMAKNARLAFISTTPVGSYMAERLLQKFATKYSYEVGTQYVNLGYLPGGAGGIQVFAELPLTTVGRDWFLGNLWEKDALKSVTKFSNFSAVIVMTDNPDTGRLWIEQAEPSLRPQPMLMVTSAQAEPMLRPYLTSGQVKGMVSGLEDGALYENLINNPDSPTQARSYWGPFGVAVLAAELLIIIGGVWSLMAGPRFRRANKTDQDEA
jgi:hypothetical protein